MRTTGKFAVVALLALAGCKTAEPGVEVRTVTKIVEVQRPCPGVAPDRPAPLGPLPTDAVKLAAVLGAKLAEWSGPGAFADRAEAIFSRCLSE